MKKTLFILCALMLTAVGASAETTEYTFNAKDWVGVSDRSVPNETTGAGDGGSVTSSDDGNNTITVVAGKSLDNTYTNNIALQNAYENDAYVTASETVTNTQHWFVVIGTSLSTADGASKLWWMNGANDGEWDPTEVETLSDGQVLIAWDLRIMPEIDNNLQNETNALDGWICFGLTSSDETNHTSVISDINFYTEEDFEKLISSNIKPYEFNAKDWVALSDHIETSVSTNSDGNISVTYTGAEAGLANSSTAALGQTTVGITTGEYYITNDQCWFVIIGEGLSTTATQSLWWMNGYNEGSTWTPTTVTTLDDGSVMLAWDLTASTAGTYLQDESNLLDGWTGFGLKAANDTGSGGSFTISNINFYTADEVEEISSGDAHFCTANIDHWTLTQTVSGTLGNFYVDYAEKDDGSGMEPPFLTYYVWEGESGSATNYLPDTKITHETIEGLTAGVYEVSMDIRIIDYDTDANVSEGTTFNANSVSQDIKLGVDANEISFYDDGDRDDIYGTYTLYVEVGEEGTLSVSLDIKDATYNWIMFKNLTVRLLGEDETIPSGTVSGTMGADYGTLILPFDATITDGLTAYTAGEVTNDADGESVLTLTAVDGNLTAGTPYIIGGTSGSETYTFSGMPTKYEVSYTDGLLTGTLVNLSLANGDFTTTGNQYVLQNHEDEGGLAFYPITSESTGVTLDAYHCYLTYSETTPTRLVIGFAGSDGEATAIEAVESEEEAEANGAIYDLSGRKVSKAVKGVYIQNGKKVLVK